MPTSPITVSVDTQELADEPKQEAESILNELLGEPNHPARKNSPRGA